MALDYLPSPGWAVIYGETPSATRWSELGDNDDALATGAGIDNLAILNRHLAAGIVDPTKMAVATTWLWEKLADVTLSTTGTSISSGTITAKNHIMIILIAIPTGGTLNVGIRFNNDSGNNYAESGTINGGTNATGASLPQINTKTAIDANHQLTTGQFDNNASREKLGIMNSVIRNAAGAANPPERKEGAYKWANTSVQITRVDAVDTGGTGDLAAGSRLIILGHN